MSSSATNRKVYSAGADPEGPSAVWPKVGTARSPNANKRVRSLFMVSWICSGCCRNKTPPARIGEIRAQRRQRGDVSSGFFVGGGISADAGARNRFATEWRKVRAGIFPEGDHGIEPKSSRTKLAEKSGLESADCKFCRLGKKLSFRQVKIVV